MKTMGVMLAAVLMLSACGAGDPPETESRVDLTTVWTGS